MSYPSVRSKDWSNERPAVNHTVDLPPTVSAGDTILVFFICDDNEVITWPDEGTVWHIIYEEDAGNLGPTMVIAWKKAIGNEGGTTITVTTGSSEHSVHISYAIQDAADPDSYPPEVSPEASGQSAYPNPAALTPGGGSLDYLWIALSGNDDGCDLVTAYPFADNQERHQSNEEEGGCVIGICTQEYTGTVVDPSTFTIEDSEQWEAATIAVHPVPSGGPTPNAFNALTYASGSPVAGAWNKVIFDPDPPSTGTWNKLKYKVT